MPARVKATGGQADRALKELAKHGLLLQTDLRLPNVCQIVAGEPVRGSWWAHPKSHEIFRVNCALADHPNVLVLKLISGKVTYVERSLWPAVIAVARAREAWQTADLSSVARELLEGTDRAPVAPDRRQSKAASELEQRLLVYSEQFHTEAGAHAKRVESWDHWLRRTGFSAAHISPDQAREMLERRMESINHQFNARGRLPWQKSA